MTGPERDVDLTNCDREPIHILGRVQSHGLMLVLREPELTIVQVSSNAPALVGREAGALVGQPLAALVTPDHVETLRSVLAAEAIDGNPLYVWTAAVDGAASPFDATVHRHRGALILELEPLAEGAPRRDLMRQARNAVARLQRAESMADFCQVAADEVRQLTGFDRVMVYEFDDDGHGSVVAESRAGQVESYLGLHYPASDVPRQARALYVLNWLRLIADVGDAPATLVPDINPDTGAPLDMSFAVLRSVSPIHIEYLGNMGVGASMSISIVQHGELWGLIACHHYAPRFVSYEVRAACEFLAHAVSLQLEFKQRAETRSVRERMFAMVPQFAERMRAAGAWQAGLLGAAPALLEFVDCGGCAVCGADAVTLLGAAPPEAAVRELVAWLASATPGDDVYATDRIGQQFPPLAAHRATASGVLALPAAPGTGEYVLWFRPEEVQEVRWAGEPAKAVTADGEGMRLRPRTSFAIWKEQRRGQSRAWQPFEVDAARALRVAITEAVARRAEQLARLNDELERSNVELDAFTYIASHDLREPLRGIYNYAHFLIEDYGDSIGPGGQAQIQSMIRLARRMDTLLESLLQYSRVGRLDLALRDVDLGDVVDDVLDTLRLALDEQGAAVRVERPLPVVRCDPVRVAEVFSNLILNGVKYNDAAHKQIVIGALAAADLQPRQLPPDGSVPPGPVVYVRDNGIGIPERYLQEIFRIFRRLHARDSYGGGSGAGLTIARKILERHGGVIWATSAEGQGTTFFFTLQAA